MKKKMRLVFGGILFLAGMACFLYPNFREWNMQREVNQIIEKFEDYDDNSESDSESNVSEDKDYDDSEESQTVTYTELYYEMERYNGRLRTSGQDIMDAWSYEQAPADLDLSSLKDDVIGYIEIPDMKVRMPLYLGASSDNLAKGAAVLSETSMPIGGESTNCVIAGHRGWRGSAYFQYIENMEVGSMVYVTNPWETLTYTVTGTKVVNPDEKDAVMIQEGKDMVTLISCHPYVLGGGPYRYLVFCERVNPAEEQVSASDQEEQIIDEQDTNETEEPDVQIQEDNLLLLESKMRILLPAFVLVAAGVIIFIRCFQNRRKKGRDDFC